MLEEEEQAYITNELIIRIVMDIKFQSLLAERNCWLWGADLPNELNTTSPDWSTLAVPKIFTPHVPVIFGTRPKWACLRWNT